MKQKDILLIAVIVVVSGTISFLLSKFLFTIPKSRQTKVEVVQAISSDFAQPNTKYFNTNSVDPTKNITIGDNQNTQPFSSSNGQ
jgi:hypothetical protein